MKICVLSLTHPKKNNSGFLFKTHWKKHFKHSRLTTFLKTKIPAKIQNKYNNNTHTMIGFFKKKRKQSTLLLFELVCNCLAGVIE